ncbi:MAG: hypothetical protein KA140_03290 [Caldisericia bacterium]|nr:hypothetical protein [Caldisericia bacterium]
MQIARKVLLKVVVTDDFKKRYAAQIKGLQNEVNVELEKIKTTEQQFLLKVNNMDYNYVMQVREQLEREKATRESTVKELDERMKEMEAMQPGTVFTQGTLDSFIDLKVGDNLEEKLGKAEIVIKDGVIQSINEG